MANENLRNIPIKHIESNPENPRIIFDQEKLDALIKSIKERGEILVPLSVFLNKKNKYTIIDGERRYRAALKLGLSELPVIIRKNPKESEYITDMFHIHNMCEPWELVPTATKLREIIDFFKKQYKKDPSEEDLNKLTGLSRSGIRRCKNVLELPIFIQDLMLKEESRTSKEKKIIGKDKILTEDFFIEVAKNIIKPLEQNNKKLFEESGKEKGIFECMIQKRKGGLIKNIVSLRPVSKYIKEHPRRSNKSIKDFILKENYSLENLLIDTGLEFDLYKFERNLKVFSGAITNIPEKLPPESKREISKFLRKMKGIINEKLKILKK